MSARAIWLIVCISLAASCNDPYSQKVSGSYDVKFAGCRQLKSKNTCFIKPDDFTKITFWIEPALGAEFSLLVDGKKIPVERKDLDSGTRVYSRIAAGSRRLVLMNGDGNQFFSLKLRSIRPCPQVDEARDLFSKGAPAKALVLLSTAAQGSNCRAKSAGAKGRLLLAMDKPTEAADYLRQAIELDVQDENMVARVDDTLTLAWILTFRKPSYTEAGRLLDELGSLIQERPELMASWKYYRGQLARENGDIRTAMELFSDSEIWARRLGLSRLLFGVVQALADCMQVLGREAKADALLQKLLQEESRNLSPCDLAALYTNQGWLRLRWHKDGADARAPLEKALILYRGKCSSREDEANILLNLSLVSLLRHDLDEAKVLLDKASAVQPEPGLLLDTWMSDIRGRLELENNRPGNALEIYKKMQRKTLPLSFSRWRSQVGKAKALRLMGRIDDSLDEYELAEGLLDRQVCLVPLSKGRTGFLGDKLSATSEFIDLLLKKGLKKKAMNAARRSRARALWALAAGRTGGKIQSLEKFRISMNRLQQLQEKIDTAASDDLPALMAKIKSITTKARMALDHAWGISLPRLPNDDIASSYDSDTCFLIYHPLPEGWVGFGYFDGKIIVKRLEFTPTDHTTDERLSRVLLEPFKKMIVSSGQVAVLPFGQLQHVDFHALALDGRLLSDWAPVVYPLDVPVPTPVVKQEQPFPLALQVVDPSGNLPGARKVADSIEKSLLKNGWNVRRLDGTRAKRKSVLAELGQAGLFHFSGHARFGGLDGWDSSLVLYDKPGIGVADILASARVPRVVILAACKSGTAASSGPTGLGLAQAFILAGAKVVVGSSRELDDETAARLFETFYKENSFGPGKINQSSKNIARAIERTQLKLLSSCSSCDGSSLRVLIP